MGRPRDGSGSPPEPGRSQVSFAPAGHSLWPASARLWHWLGRVCWVVGAGSDEGFGGVEEGGLEEQEEGVVRG